MINERAGLHLKLSEFTNALELNWNRGRRQILISSNINGRKASVSDIVTVKEDCLYFTSVYWTVAIEKEDLRRARRRFVEAHHVEHHVHTTKGRHVMETEYCVRTHYISKVTSEPVPVT